MNDRLELDLVQATIVRLYAGREINDKERQELDALVEIAEAARVVNGDGVGEFDTRTTSALFPLRRALSVLDDREET